MMRPKQRCHSNVDIHQQLADMSRVTHQSKLDLAPNFFEVNHSAPCLCSPIPIPRRSMSSVGVRVVVRVRPANEREKREIKASSEDFAYSIQNTSSAQSISLTGRSLSAPFDAAFDNIFDSDSSQDQLFQTVALPTVQDVLNGYNGTILAYGQTGSGKSFTMFGAGDLVNGAQRGLIPRSANAIFEGLRKSDCEEVTIKMSFLEIYNEVVRDLLNPHNLKLKIRERPDETVFVEGLMESYVTSEREIFSLMQVGESNRSVSATEMNAVSSRSHSLLMLTVQQKSADGSTRVGRLNFADLAGSEKIKKTGATGQLLDEAKKINQSLSALGNCIFALTEDRRGHVPFRDSKLTFILKNSLGGNSKTTLVVTASPHIFNAEETLSTLRFAQRAKLVKNTVTVNKQRSVQDLTLLLQTLERKFETGNCHIRNMCAVIEYVRAQYMKGVEAFLPPNMQQLLDQAIQFLDGKLTLEQSLDAQTINSSIGSTSSASPAAAASPDAEAFPHDGPWFDDMDALMTDSQTCTTPMVASSDSKRVDELEAQVRLMQDMLQEQASTAAAQTSELEEELADARLCIDAKTKDNELLISTVQELKSQASADQLKRQADVSLEMEKRQLACTELEVALKKISMLQQRLSEKEADLSSLSDELSVAQQSNTELSAANERLVAKSKSDESTISETKKALADSKAMFENELQRAASSHNESLSMLKDVAQQSAREAFEAELAELRHQHTEAMTIELAKARGRAEAGLAAAAARYKQQSAAKDAEMRELRDDFEQQRAMLQSRLDLAAREQSLSEQRVNEMQTKANLAAESIAELNQSVDQRDQEIVALKDNVAEQEQRWNQHIQLVLEHSQQQQEALQQQQQGGPRIVRPVEIHRPNEASAPSNSSTGISGFLGGLFRRSSRTVSQAGPQWSRLPLCKEGLLQKRSDWTKIWNARYFQLRSGCLVFWTADDKARSPLDIRGSIDLPVGTIVNSVQKYVNITSGGKGRTVTLQATTDKEADEWSDAVSAAISQ